MSLIKTVAGCVLCISFVSCKSVEKLRETPEKYYESIDCDVQTAVKSRIEAPSFFDSVRTVSIFLCERSMYGIDIVFTDSSDVVIERLPIGEWHPVPSLKVSNAEYFGQLKTDGRWFSRSPALVQLGVKESQTVSVHLDMTSDAYYLLNDGVWISKVLH